MPAGLEGMVFPLKGHRIGAQPATLVGTAKLALASKEKWTGM